MREKIFEILCEFNEEIKNRSQEDNLLEAGLIDSFGIVELIVELEEAFEIEIDGEWITEENFASVAAIASLIEQIKKGKK